jgi:murein DD-endopeptidase MepM/ murein hydrolase activator NlpD
LEKENLDQRKLNVETEEANLKELLEEKGRKINEYETDIHNREQAIKQYEEDLAAQQELIAATEAAIAEEKRKLLESGGSVIHFDGGMFSFPMASYTRISDEYGYRTHPILGVEQFHNGVDFAAPSGTAIYAAYDGKVVAAAYSATMGNYVMIDHGDGLYTIYMHASALYIGEGAIVVKGETIAAVGSTGRSTGNHLHFTVRLNGSYVSPWNYLKQ